MSSTLDAKEFSGTTRTYGINWTYCTWRTQVTKWTKQFFFFNDNKYLKHKRRRKDKSSGTIRTNGSTRTIDIQRTIIR